jgi:hypothetical protein
MSIPINYACRFLLAGASRFLHKTACTPKLLLFTTASFCCSLLNAQSGVYVTGGNEMAIYQTVNLDVSGSPSASAWATQRAAAPGFLSLVGAASLAGASNSYNVNGYVKYYQNNSGITTISLPVGTGTTLRSLAVQSIPANAVFGTAWIDGSLTATIDPTDNATHPATATGAGIYAVNNTGQWDWITHSGDLSTTTVAASLPNVSSFAPTNTLRLVGWNGTQWVNLSAAQGTSAATGNTDGSTLTGTLQSGITAIAIGRVTIVVNAKVFLQGAYNAGLGEMTTTLNTSNLIPLTQPYSAAPWNYAGTETVGAIPTNVTDWILIELRDAANAVVDTRAAFVKKDGSIVDIDGISAVQFPNQPEGTYHLAIKHRNHFAIRTPAIQTVSPTSTQYNYTSLQANAYQNAAVTTNAAMKDITGVFVMWGGNANGNTVVNYGAFGSDRTAMLSNANTVGALTRGLGSNATLIISNVYSNNDLNLNGTINYGAFNTDRSFLLTTVLNNQSTSSLTQHL